MRHTMARDGITAGILGATAVALWFLGADTMYAHPLDTPAALGQGLLSFFGPRGMEGRTVFVIVYTIFHYAAFMVAGLLVSAIVYQAEREPTVLAGAMMLFVAFEIGFYGLSAALGESPFLGVLGWAQVGIGNLIAALVMGTYMWRVHPELRAELSYALAGRE